MLAGTVLVAEPSRAVPAIGKASINLALLLSAFLMIVLEKSGGGGEQCEQTKGRLLLGLTGGCCTQQEDSV